MNSIKYLFLFALYFLTGQVTKAQDSLFYRLDSLTFGAPPPKTILQDYNRSYYDWGFKKINNTWYITDYWSDGFEGDTVPFSIDSLTKIQDKFFPFRSRGYKYQLFLDTGWIVGTNKGEWGGSLYWIPRDKQNLLYIGNGNIRGIFNINGRIIILEGLCHLSMRNGQVLELKYHGSEWKVDTLYNAESCPNAAFKDPQDNLWIVTNSKLLKLDSKIQLSTVLTSDIWEYLYPTSIIKMDNYLYIAMRQGILRYHLKKKTFEWSEPVKFER